MNERHLLELRLVGRDLRPGSVRSKEIAELLESIEEAIASFVIRTNPDVAKESVVVGIASIDAGSISLRFDSPQPDPVLAAYRQVAEAVESSTFEGVPNSARRSLSRMTSFTRRHRCRVEMREPSGDRVLAVIDEDTHVSEPQLVYGHTTVYGRIIRVGGRTPRVMIENLQGASIFCDASPKVAKQLAPRLYERVRLEGKAGWDPDDWTLVEFRIEEADEGPDLDPSVAVKDLSRTIGAFFAGVDDAPLFVRRLRQGEDP